MLLSTSLSNKLVIARRSCVSNNISSVPRRVAQVQPRLVARADVETTEASVDVDKVISDVQAKWDAIENKPAVAAYAGGAVVLVWLSTTLVGAVNNVPLLPKILELIGLVYSSWFTYRYLLFKSSRQELSNDIEELKKKISGNVEN